MSQVASETPGQSRPDGTISEVYTEDFDIAGDSAKISTRRESAASAEIVSDSGLADTAGSELPSELGDSRISRVSAPPSEIYEDDFETTAGTRRSPGKASVVPSEVASDLGDSRISQRQSPGKASIPPSEVASEVVDELGDSRISRVSQPISEVYEEDIGSVSGDQIKSRQSPARKDDLSTSRASQPISEDLAASKVSQVDSEVYEEDFDSMTGSVGGDKSRPSPVRGEASTVQSELGASRTSQPISEVYEEDFDSVTGDESKSRQSPAKKGDLSASKISEDLAASRASQSVSEVYEDDFDSATGSKTAEELKSTEAGASQPVSEELAGSKASQPVSEVYEEDFDSITGDDLKRSSPATPVKSDSAGKPGTPEAKDADVNLSKSGRSIPSIGDESIQSAYEEDFDSITEDSKLGGSGSQGLGASGDSALAVGKSPDGKSDGSPERRTPLQGLKSEDASTVSEVAPDKAKAAVSPTHNQTSEGKPVTPDKPATPGSVVSEYDDDFESEPDATPAKKENVSPFDESAAESKKEEQSEQSIQDKAARLSKLILDEMFREALGIESEARRANSQASTPRATTSKQTTSQSPVPVAEVINLFDEEGVNTNPESVDAYIDELFSAATTQIDDYEAELDRFLAADPFAINAPYLPPFQFGITLFLQLERAREAWAKDIQLDDNIKEAQQIHNKLVFDVANRELLTLQKDLPRQQRASGISSAPIVWRTMGQSPQVRGRGSLAQTWLAKVKAAVRAMSETPRDGEQGMIQESNAQEPSWIDYTLEENEVKHELSDALFDRLIEDTVFALSAIHPPRSKRGEQPIVQARLILSLA
jgi:hypothetical protein